jgi:2-keto-4-pentenoate hydratase/2-oxohepta-3-ene-1,7-dioic acid hydratase in catechol pathway
MRLAALNGRTMIVTASGVVDVADVSEGRFGPESLCVFDRWMEFREWAATADLAPAATPFDADDLQAPSPSPRQVFAIGLNYRDHASEAGTSAPIGSVVPPTFTKFRDSLVGPSGPLLLPSTKVDWEVELVVVIGRPAKEVPAEKAWEYVAGLTVGQDYSERDVQREGPYPQFSMAKSYPGFGPTGPYLVTPDEFDNPDDLSLECLINGETVQKARTSALIVPVPQLVAKLSLVCTLLPGDLIFTGTPSGVGLGRTPETYLKPGDIVVSRIEGIGELRQTCVAGW